MTRKEQNKILDAKIESNVNQYKVDRMNAEISAFSSGDLNKYEFLKRIDLNYEPNALDKVRFEFSSLDKTFSTGLDKTAQGYQEEVIIKLLKDIRDGLAGGITPRAPRAPRAPGLDGSDDDEQKRLSKLLEELRTDEDNEEFRNEPKEDKLDKFVQSTSSLEHNVNDDNMPDSEATLNKFKDKIDNFDEIVKNKKDTIDKEFQDKENRLNKLNDNVKKIKSYIKENNNKIIVMKNELDYTENKRNNLLLNINQLYNELKETKNELNKSGNHELKEKVDYKENEIKKLESELNEKDKNINILKSNIKNLEDRNFEILARSNEYFKEIDKLKKINNTSNQKIQELEKYFNDHEENRIEKEKEIKKLSILNDKLIKEKKK